MKRYGPRSTLNDDDYDKVLSAGEAPANVSAYIREGMVGAESYFCLTVLDGAMAAKFCPELLVGAPRSPDPPSRTPSFFRGAASSCG